MPLVRYLDSVQPKLALTGSAGGTELSQLQKRSPVKRRQRDTQRSKVYNWERSITWPTAADAPMTLADCGKLIKRVYKLYGKPAPRLGDGRRRQTASGSEYHIKLPRWARRGWVVLHECAHGLQRIYCPGKAAHGPEFMAIFLELLSQVYGMSQYQLETAAASFRVKVAGESYHPEIVKGRTK